MDRKCCLLRHDQILVTSLRTWHHLNQYSLAHTILLIDLATSAALLRKVPRLSLLACIAVYFDIVLHSILCGFPRRDVWEKGQLELLVHVLLRAAHHPLGLEVFVKLVRVRLDRLVVLSFDCSLLKAVQHGAVLAVRDPMQVLIKRAFITRIIADVFLGQRLEIITLVPDILLALVAGTVREIATHLAREVSCDIKIPLVALRELHVLPGLIDQVRILLKRPHLVYVVVYMVETLLRAVDCQHMGRRRCLLCIHLELLTVHLGFLRLLLALRRRLLLELEGLKGCD